MIQKNFLVNINLNKNELQNAKLHNLAAAPTLTVTDKGYAYWDTSNNTAAFWTGTAWKTLESASVDLSLDTRTSTTNPVLNTGGTGFTLLEATDTYAGLFGALDHAKLSGIAIGANNYVHPTGDGNLHVPANGTTNSGKVLTAGATSGLYTWQTPTVGTVTSVTGVLPISSSGGATPAISIRDASNTQNGAATAAHIAAIEANTAKITNATHTGDATGATALTVIKIQGVAVDSTAPANGDFMRYNSTGTKWENVAIVAADVPTLTAVKISDFDTQVRTSRLDQMATPTSDVSMNTHKITNVVDPTGEQDAATKNYVDASRSGLSIKDPVRVASTANIVIATGTLLTIDGVLLVAGNRVLLKNQTAGAENGIYIAAAGAWSRSSDADTSVDVVPGMAVWVNEGTINGDARFVLTTNAPITLGTTALVFTKDFQAADIVAGSGMTKSGNTLDVVGTANRITANADSIDIASTYVGQSSITTVGTIGTGTWNGADIADAYIASAATWNAKGTAKKQIATIGDGTSTTISVAHTLGTDVIAQARFATTSYAGGTVTADSVVECDIVLLDSTHVTFNFATAPATNSIKVVIIG